MSDNPIDAYLTKAPEPQRKTLAAVRKTLRRLLPGAEETLSYGMPCFKVDGKGVAAFAAFKGHCTYFPMSGSVAGALKIDLSAYRVSKGGKMSGKWEFFRRDGSVMRTGEFKSGSQVGTWRTWDKSGRMVKETTFGIPGGSRTMR